MAGDRGEGSEVKSTHCFYSGTELGAQNPHQVAQVPVTLAVGDLVPSSAYREHCIHKPTHRHMHKTSKNISFENTVCRMLVQHARSPGLVPSTMQIRYGDIHLW